MDKLDKRRKYDDAFKAEALRLTRESRSTQAAARARNIDPKRIYQWQRQAEAPRPADPAEAAEMRQLRAANRRLEQELEILKKVIAIFSTDPMSCWQFIEQERSMYFVDLLCRTLDVSPARYYAWRKPCPSAGDWQEVLKQAFSDHRRCYGTRRLRTELLA